MTHMLHCPYGHGTESIRHGTTSEGQQRSRCRQCRLGHGGEQTTHLCLAHMGCTNGMAQRHDRHRSFDCPAPAERPVF
jgi:transposase-like protein